MYHPPLRIKHYSGTAVLIPTKVAPCSALRIQIKNLDELNDLEISFDGGGNFYSISPRATLGEGGEEAIFAAFHVRAIPNFDFDDFFVAYATAGALPAYTGGAGPGPGATLTGNAVGVLTVDGAATALGDRILVKNEGVSDTDHGIYAVTTEGSPSAAYVLTRATNHDSSAEITQGDYATVSGGTVNGGRTFQITTANPITVDVTPIKWVELVAEWRALIGEV